MTKRIIKQNQKAFGSLSMICDICKTSENDDAQLGQKYEYMTFRVHYFCLLLTYNLYQSKNQNKGLLGFSATAIKRAYTSIKSNECCYCKKVGANVMCCEETCKQFYHLPCGLKSKCIVQYYGEFKSYCHQHSPKQNFSEEDKIYSLTNSHIESSCRICHDSLIPEVSHDVLWAPCCRNGFFHRCCVLKLAYTAGSVHFKCPLCNNINLFVDEMKKIGIYVPFKDAAWELEPNAFYELYLRYDKCDAETCICPQSRTYNGDPDTDWMLMLCAYCGSSGIHKACYNLDDQQLNQIYKCDLCTNSCKQFGQSFILEYSLSSLKYMKQNDYGSNSILEVVSETSSESDINSSDEISSKKIINSHEFLRNEDKSSKYWQNDKKNKAKDLSKITVRGEKYLEENAGISSSSFNTKDLQVSELQAHNTDHERDNNFFICPTLKIETDTKIFGCTEGKRLRYHGEKENNIYEDETKNKKVANDESNVVGSTYRINRIEKFPKRNNRKKFQTVANCCEMVLVLENDVLNNNDIDIVGNHPTSRPTNSVTSDYVLNKQHMNLHNNQISRHVIRSNQRSLFENPVWKQNVGEIKSSIVENVNNQEASAQNSNSQVVYTLANKKDDRNLSNFKQVINNKFDQNLEIAKMCITTSSAQLSSLKNNEVSEKLQSAMVEGSLINPIILNAESHNSLLNLNQKLNTYIDQIDSNCYVNQSMYTATKISTQPLLSLFEQKSTSNQSAHVFFKYLSPGELVEVNTDPISQANIIQGTSLNFEQTRNFQNFQHSKPMHSSENYIEHTHAKKILQIKPEVVNQKQKINIISMQTLIPGELAKRCVNIGQHIQQKSSKSYLARQIPGIKTRKNNNPGRDKIVNSYEFNIEQVLETQSGRSNKCSNRLNQNLGIKKINLLQNELKCLPKNQTKESRRKCLRNVTRKYFSNNIIELQCNNSVIVKKSDIQKDNQINMVEAENHNHNISKKIDYDEHYSQEAGPSNISNYHRQSYETSNVSCDKVPAYVKLMEIKKLKKSLMTKDVSPQKQVTSSMNKKFQNDFNNLNIIDENNYVVLPSEVLRNSRHDELLENFRKSRKAYSENKEKYKNGEMSKKDFFKYWTDLENAIANFREEILKIKKNEFQNFGLAKNG